jgi:GT2 family glycosyltransferase
MSRELRGCEVRFSIIIPCYKHPDLANQILMDIYQNCPTVDEVIVVDDASKDVKTSACYDFWKTVQSFPLRVIELEENVGFLKASNRGLREATGDIIALISSDVRIKKDLKKAVSEIMSPHDKVLLGGRLLDYDTGWNCFDGRIFPYIEGWALIMAKMGWTMLGYFDEQFAPHDFEDVDLSTEAINAGCELKAFAPWQGDVLEHMVAQTIGYSDERRAITEAHRELFRAKWVTKVNP